MNTHELYLTPDFFQFAATIQSLNEEKAKLKTAFKKQYDKYIEDVDAIAEQVKKVVNEFEEWKAGQLQEQPVSVDAPKKEEAPGPKSADEPKVVVGNKD